MLGAGTRLGPYEIMGSLGAGGMGEVYRARDTKLNRHIALKVLPAIFTSDPDRFARFRREAHVLASLNHPNIAAIYGFEESTDTQALVLELVDGPTLADRISQGAIPLDEALAIAKQIVEALQAAHDQGIIHRDLKPANIKVRPDGTVKVLDFGLAKSIEPAAGSGEVSKSPTITTPAMSQLGVVLGTAAYMSPEQAKGRPADKRSDIWGFGCVLYEMLTGTRAFDGEDVTDTIAAIIRGEPDWNRLPPDLPAQIRLLITRCLEKDRKNRISDIGVAKFLMTETIGQPAPTITAAPPGGEVSRSGRQIVAGGLAVALAVAAIAVWAVIALREPPPHQPVRFAIVPPATTPLSLRAADRKVTISPDGTHVVYRFTTESTTEIAVRALDELDSRPLAGTAGRDQFVSPDGRWIGFFTLDTELKKISITGGPAVTVCRLSAAPRGASWGADDTIVFSTSDARTGLWSVSAGGGEAKMLTTPDASNNEVGHLFPFILPNEKAVLFTIGAGRVENMQVAVIDLKTGQQKTLIRGGSDARYVETGHLVYAAAGTLRAVRFDPDRLEVLGDAVPVVEQVLMEATGAASFAVSRQGTLVYVPGAVGQSVPMRSLVWVNRQGREEPIKAQPRPYAIPRLSPDGTRAAVDVRDQNSDIWIWDLARQTLTPLNRDPAIDMSPVWTPDGRRIIWTSARAGGNPNLYWQSADGTGTPERLTTNPGAQFPTSISADGTRIALFGGTGGGTGMEISTLTMTSPSTPGQRQAERLFESAATNFVPEISPDGRWIAYQSNESGQFQVYVRPFPRVDEGRSQISPDGGTRPAWSRNGRELFYLDGNDLLTSVPIQTTGTSFSAGKPTKILSTRYYPGFTTRGYDLRGYDVSPDGQRFLMVKDNASAEQTSTASPPGMVVVLNWSEELKARVPMK